MDLEKSSLTCGTNKLSMIILTLLFPLPSWKDLLFHNKKLLQICRTVRRTKFKNFRHCWNVMNCTWHAKKIRIYDYLSFKNIHLIDFLKLRKKCKIFQLKYVSCIFTS